MNPFKSLVSYFKSVVEPLFDAEAHALGGLATGAFGLVSGNHTDLFTGAGYAAFMKLLSTFSKSSSSNAASLRADAEKLLAQADAVAKK